ncbi:unnamed protein product [Cyprideis torosa]|uniref:Uncharacterized protein n=1 Tax=Cyprideis torosa TaxID=163714 RepID=A0A7R8WEI6_9CRUS|nr:unnamed protein product [Cyprideis torosa]CAG0890365.1 unnamed protein product [Cyprideis torosa]
MTGCEPLSPANSVAVMDCVMAPVSSSGRRQHARELKRSVIGVRVAAQGLDGRYYTGTIEHVRTHVEFGEKLKEPLYHVRFDRGHRGEFKETEMVGPGFRPVSSVKLRAGQLVYITYNGREVSGVVVHHRPQIDEVVVSIQREGSERDHSPLEPVIRRKSSCPERYSILVIRDPPPHLSFCLCAKWEEHDMISHGMRIFNPTRKDVAYPSPGLAELLLLRPLKAAPPDTTTTGTVRRTKQEAEEVEADAVDAEAVEAEAVDAEAAEADDGSKNWKR